MIDDVPGELNRVRRLFRERFTFQISVDTYSVPQGLRWRKQRSGPA